MRLKMLAFLLFSSLLPVRLMAQSGAGQGSIEGVVQDQAGAVVPGATVTARNLAMQLSRSVPTDSSGHYIITNLPPADYEVTFVMAGFARVVQPNVTVMTGQRAIANATLKVSATQETITVTAEQPLVETTKTEVSSYVSETEIANLPINGRRWDSFVMLTPAVTNDGGFGLVSYRGISGLYNNNMIDGMDNNQAFFSEARGRTRLTYAISQSTVREFQVGTSNYAAEFGRAAGGLVNAVTKSGSNSVKGEAFYFIRDQALNATNPTLKVDPILNSIGFTKPPDRRQQFGGAVGGPLVRDRLFWFLDYDQQKRHFPAAILPTSSTFLRQTGTAPALEAARAFFASKVTQQPRSGNQEIGLAKLDWQISSANLLSSTVNILRWDSLNGIQTGVNHANDFTANGDDGVNNEYLIFRLNSVLSPTLVNEARFQYGRDFEFQTANALGPLLGITGGINVGMREFLPRPAFPKEKAFQWMDNLSWVRGRHNMKAGVDVRYVRDLMINLRNGGGNYSYSVLNDFALDCTAPSFPFACTGTPSGALTGKHYNSFTQAFDTLGAGGRLEFATTDYGFFFQDSMQALPGLTLQLGLRYEYQSIAQPQGSPLDPRTSRINLDRNNFGPRFGFSWDPFKNHRTVVRGGYGIFYARTQNSTISNFFTNNGQRLPSFFFTPTTAGAPVFPNLLSTIPTGGASRPDLVVAASDLVNPLIHQYEFAIEREIARGLSVSASYLGSRGQRLPYFRDVNVFPPTDTVTLTVDCAANPGNAACQNAPATVTIPFFRGPARPNSAVGQILLAESTVNQWYNAFVLQVRRRFSRGFSMQAAFTFAKNQDNGQSSDTFNAGNQPLNPLNQRAEYAVSNLDQRKRFVLSAFWEPPFGRISNTALRTLLNGFKFSGVATAGDGFPVSASTSGSTSAPGIPALSSGPLGVRGSSRAPWLGRNTFTSPGSFNVDFRVARDFRVTERARLELIWEAFNIFNRTNVTSVVGTAFNVSGTRLTARNDFLSPSQTSNFFIRERQMQLGARFRF